MSLKISADAQTALEWAFGAYADKDLGIPFDVILAVDLDGTEATEENVELAARTLVQKAVHDGIGSRLCLGWCTFMKEGRYGIGVLALQRSEAKAA